MSRSQPVTISEEDARLADSSHRTLQNLLAEQPILSGPLRLRLERSDGETVAVPLPGAAVPLLLSLLQELSQRKGVAVVTLDAELTTQQAADYMHVSRPYIVKLLDQGEIPSRKVGVRRRVLLEDVLRYMQTTGDTAASALDQMASENQTLGFYP